MAKDIIDLNKNYPALCTRGVILFPNNDVNIEAGRVFSKVAIKDSLINFDGYIVVIPQINPNSDVIDKSNLSKYGCVAKIKTSRNFDNGIVKISLTGIRKVLINDIYSFNGAYYTEFDAVDDVEGDKENEEAYIRTIAQSLEDFISVSPNITKSIVERLSKGVSAADFTDIIAQSIVNDFKTKLQLFEEVNVISRLSIIAEYIESEKEIIKIENRISQKVRKKIDEGQKEYILREKLRAIKEELGDVANNDDDANSIRNKLKDNPYPEYVKNKVISELNRLEQMPTASSEYSMLKTYIDWVMAIPWYQKTEDNNDIKRVEEVLEEDHYGLEKIKERIVEYLAVKTLTSSLKAPILCFVGPPGVGKTSLAKSIARALERKFVKMSLGGMKDESEIRGHRRTYLGSLPGRVLQAMKKAGVINPVFLLDEIDKMGADYKGDPASAMLELLDPEQNKYFSDHYIEEPYDLSNVMFIATANYLENIPAPLRDRLEIIHISSYTEIEKTNIALKHLCAKQLIAHGLDKENIIFTEDAILHIIRYYTREAGVRNLERAIAKICRKLVVRMLKNNRILDIHVIDVKAVQEFLGKEIFDYSRKEKEDQIGVVTGLAYTEFGGDILPIEVNYFAGKGNLIVTGSLGDVMKESASIAFDYVKANADLYNIDKELFSKIDLHIHVPEGAVPKDGPSAGITMTTAIVSALTRRPVKSSLAMTGEVTLRGNVLPIGGLKEKSISAHRSGIHTVIIPYDNQKDLDELPKLIQEEVKFIPVKNVKEVINIALK